MAERTATRVARLLSMASYLSAHGATTFADLALHFGVSEAAIERDLSLLWVTGLPGYSHGDLLDFNAGAFERGIAELTEDQGLRQVRLSTREGITVIAALSTMVEAGVAPPAAASALEKVRALVRDEVVQVESEKDIDPAVNAALSAAVQSGHVATVEYVDAKGRRTERSVHPHRLVAIDGVGYVECYCERAQDYRTLRLDRITSASVTDRPVVVEPSTNPGFVHHHHYDAVVRVKRAWRWVIEAIPHGTITDHGDHVEARFPVYDPAWVAARLAVAGLGLVSVQPDELRDHVGAHARAVVSSQRG